MVVASPPALIGRDVELERLDRFISSVADGPELLLLCGEAGIGKTSLWRAAAEQARANGLRVLRARCAQVELPIAFAALADLVECASAEVAQELSGVQRAALARAFGHGPAAEDAPDWLALAGAVLATMRTLARRAPIVLAIDDLQWLDRGSQRVLAYALRRVEDAPVAVLATVRGSGFDEDPFALSDLLPPERFVRLQAGPLSAGALQHMIFKRLGIHLPRPTLARVHRASGGNPMFALEFAHALLAEGRGSQAAPLEVPDSLERLVHERVAALPHRLVPLLELAAALERPTSAVLLHVMESDEAEELLDEAVRAGALIAEEDGRLRFTHPLLASAFYFGVATHRRHALHRHLANVVEGLEERGRHAALGAIGPNAETAALVERAAAAAAGRGALDAAAALAIEAARLTPAAEEAAARRRSLAGATWLVETGEFSAALQRLDPLLAAALPDHERAEALLLRAECELPDRLLLVGMLREALAFAHEPRVRWHVLIRLAQQEGWVSGNAPLATERAREAVELARRIDDPALLEISLAALAFYQAAQGDRATRPKHVRGTRHPSPTHMQWWQISPALSLGCRKLWAGELDHARTVLEGEYEAHDGAGREAHAGFVACWLAEVEWRAGRWQRAEALAREATERLGNLNPSAYPRALLAASAGRIDEAQTHASGALAWAEANAEGVSPPRFSWVLGLLDLSRGEFERARTSLSHALTLLDAAGIREPGYVPVLPDLIESLVALGRLDEAEPLLERLEADAAASGHRWAAPAARRCRALILLARAAAAPAASLADDAAKTFGTIGAPFDRARALLAAGQAKRRLGQRREAAQRLGEAADIFSRLGAPLWRELAQHELRRASPRPRRDRDKLTAAETRVAALVAAGRTNKEVATSLYTTVATVEAHLTRIYRKLHVRSRSELARRVADGTVALENVQESGSP